MDIRPIGNGVQSGSTAPPASDVSTSATSAPIATAQAASPSVSEVIAQQADPSAKQVSDAVQKINTAMASQSQGIEFSIDSTSHRIVVKIIDQQTNQVIKEIPSKQALEIADALDQTQGLVDKTTGLMLHALN
jgi:flagellar protein FlaG